MPTDPNLKGIDPRYGYVHIMYEKGMITTFLELFKWIPKTTADNDMKMKIGAFNDLLAHPEKFSLERIVDLAALFDIDYEIVVRLIVQYYLNLKAAKASGDQLH
jgi:hypothetical protein